MDIQKAREILKRDFISSYVDWQNEHDRPWPYKNDKGEPTVTLEGTFTAEHLRALLWFVENPHE
jgi:hypothetical protein